jgi:hypothetical protein
MSQDSAVDIVTRLRPEGRRGGGGGGLKNFNILQNVHTGSEFHSFSYSMRTVFLSKLYEDRDAKIWPPSADVKNKWSYVLRLLVVLLFFSFLVKDGL